MKVISVYYCEQNRIHTLRRGDREFHLFSKYVKHTEISSKKLEQVFYKKGTYIESPFLQKAQTFFYWR